MAILLSFKHIKVLFLKKKINDIASVFLHTCTYKCTFFIKQTRPHVNRFRWREINLKLQYAFRHKVHVYASESTFDKIHNFFQVIEVLFLKYILMALGSKR